jgi:hypothetical protein
MLNFLNFRQLDTALLHKAGLNENDVIPALRIVMINDKLMKLYRLLDGLNDPWFHKTTTLAAASDVEILTDAQITSFTSGTLTLVRAAGTWRLGQLLSISIFSGAGAHVADFLARVVSGQGTATAVLSVISGTPVTLGANKITVISPFGCTASTLDLSTTYVKDILKIYDNAYTGGKIRLFTPIKDPAIFAVLHRDPFFDARIAYFHLGNSVELYIGPSATALGTIQFEYRGKPALCTDFDTDVVIDIPPEDNQILMDEVLSEYLQAAGKEVPPDVQARNNEFQKRYDAAQTDLQKTQATVSGHRSN